MDLALVLAIDCSLSVDDYDYRLQLRGTGQALIDSALTQLIGQGNSKMIAVSAFLWSSPQDQQMIVPWRILSSSSGAAQVADEIFAAPRKIDAGATATGDALAFAAALLQSAPPAARRVIDVSTNGHSNMGRPVEPIRQSLLADGVTINGLAVSDREPGLKAYLERAVIGGPGSFVLEASDYNAYTLAIRMKLFREIAGQLPV
ncbi:MAG: DUF1194 domain-containing protein [Alphaproteobacteria bacterium]|nr:DUF1194 domain-containing protein [Alphaproteobacteria bacterium]